MDRFVRMCRRIGGILESIANIVEHAQGIVQEARKIRGESNPKSSTRRKRFDNPND